MSSVISIKPLTRVEGHGLVRIFLAGEEIEKVELRLFESPRLFEALLLGRRHDEVPEIICRICSLCSTVHRITSIQAIENALGLSVPKVVELHRELILNGGHIQSHALHLFCLALPDYYGVRGVAELAKVAREELERGLRLKRVGNLIQEMVGGRLIHPVTIIPGGMGKPLGRDDLLFLRDSLQSVLTDAEETCSLYGTFPSGRPAAPPTTFMALEPGDRPLYGNTLKLSDGRRFPGETYSSFLFESAISDTNSKWSTIGGIYPTVGAAARLAIGMPLERRAARVLDNLNDYFKAPTIAQNNLAQSVELLHAVERALLIIDELMEMKREPVRPPPVAFPQKSAGTALMEAPRGILIHSYAFDGQGLCTAADIITPTAINQGAMEQDLMSVALSLKGAAESELCHAIECRVRDYDPCISCAVHVVRL